jgi:hypothetical protein
MELVLIGLGGCSGYDVAHILEKAREAIVDDESLDMFEQGIANDLKFTSGEYPSSRIARYPISATAYFFERTSSSSASTAEWPLMSLILTRVVLPWSGRSAAIARSRARR